MFWEIILFGVRAVEKTFRCFMKTFLLLGEDQYFYEALKKQVEFNEKFLLHFSVLNKAAISFAQYRPVHYYF